MLRVLCDDVKVIEKPPLDVMGLLLMDHLKVAGLWELMVQVRTCERPSFTRGATGSMVTDGAAVKQEPFLTYCMANNTIIYYQELKWEYRGS